MFSKDPLYRQVYEMLAKRIVSGDLAKGTALPNEYELSHQLKISIGTLRKAIDLLVDDKLVDRRQGKGTFIRDRLKAMRNAYDSIRHADGSIVDWQFIHYEHRTALATAEERRVLALEPGATVVHMHRVRAIGARPVKTEDVVMPGLRFGGVEGVPASESTIVPLAERAHIRLGAARERVDVRPASERAAGELRIAAGTSVLRLRRVVTDAAGTPLEWRIAECFLRDEHYLAPLGLAA